jgi:hypothetical protein
MKVELNAKLGDFDWRAVSAVVANFFLFLKKLLSFCRILRIWIESPEV